MAPPSTVPSTVVAPSNACEPPTEPRSRPSTPVPSVITHTPRFPVMSDSTMRSPRRATRSQVQTIRTALRGRDSGIVDSLLNLDEDRGERPVDDLLRGLGGYLPSLPPSELGDLLDVEIKQMHKVCRDNKKKRKEEEARHKRLNGASPGAVRSPPQQSAATAEKAEKRAFRSGAHKK